MSTDIKKPPENPTKGKADHNVQRKIALRSIVAFISLFALFCQIAFLARPKSDDDFHPLPVIAGVYACCDAGGRYSKSWVGRDDIYCGPISYYPFLGTGRNDCGLRPELNGHQVTVTQVLVPSLGVDHRLVTEISANGFTHYKLTNQQLRKLWVSGTVSSALLFAFIVSIIIHTTQTLLNKKTKQ